MTNEMPLSHHLEELRKRFIWSIISICILSTLAFNYYSPISTIVLSPFELGLNGNGTVNVNNIYEGFFVKLKISLLSGIILSLPILVFQVCRFILPGLKKTEKKWLFIIVFFSSTLSISSTYIGYTIIFPHIISFLLTTAFIPENIQILLNYQDNLNYIISFLAGSIIIFQSPILLAILLAKNTVSRRFLVTNARWFIVGIIISSAIVTPPDIFSQLSLSIPLIGCYFGCILLAKIMRWGDTKC